MITRAEIRKADRDYQRAADRAEALRVERNDLFRRALAGTPVNGSVAFEPDEHGKRWTHAKIAEATGRTRSRIGAIASKR